MYTPIPHVAVCVIIQSVLCEEVVPLCEVRNVLELLGGII